MDYVLPLASSGPDVSHRVGGKALGLSQMISAGLAVPDGFTVTTDAYLQWIGENAAADRLETLAMAPDLETASRDIARMFTDSSLPQMIAEQIDAAYVGLGEMVPVAVRSSATAEDTEEASFAGQQDTYLWIAGVENVRLHVLRCWASLFTTRAIAYRSRMGIPSADIAMAVVVQQMVDADSAGVMMTLEPVTGDRGLIYIESARGLGEGVVKGDVETDRIWVEKDSMTVVRREIGHQRCGYFYDPEHGDVRLLDLDPADGVRPSIGEDTITRLAQLGRRIEDARNAPMDIEWAVSRDGDVKLLQARPETVWSRKQVEQPITAPTLMHEVCGADSTWTTTNAGEAVPGVQTPLSAEIMAIAGEESFRRTMCELGALSKHEVAIPGPVDERLFGWFFGRLGLHLEILCGWMDRIPGVSGEASAVQIFGHLPVGYTSRPQYRYYPRVAFNLGRPFLTGRRRIVATRRETEALWRRSTRQLPGMSRSQTRNLLLEAVELHRLIMFHHTSLTLGAVQPSYDLLEKLTADSSVSAQDLMGGHGGHDETAMVHDLWACSRGTLTLEAFLDRHGFHGPREGELSTTVWREDPAPVLAMIDGYRARPDSEDPNLAQLERAKRRVQMEAVFLAELPALRRLAGRVALWMAAKYVPARGIGKAGFVQAFDVIRACARRLGDFLVEDGDIDDPEDVFFFTLSELTSQLPADARMVVAERRRLWTRYQEVDLPGVWVGPAMPAEHTYDSDAETIDGVAASPGVIEGTVRVVLDVASAQLEPGEILVAKDTDPAWASLMFLSGGLIADIGGVMSHTAVVARELGLPCVVATSNATRVLHSGDVVRLDGTRGRIEILSRAGRQLPAEQSGVSA